MWRGAGTYLPTYCYLQTSILYRYASLQGHRQQAAWRCPLPPPPPCAHTVQPADLCVSEELQPLAEDCEALLRLEHDAHKGLVPACRGGGVHSGRSIGFRHDHHLSVLARAGCCMDVHANLLRAPKARYSVGMPSGTYRQTAVKGQQQVWQPLPPPKRSHKGCC